MSRDEIHRERLEVGVELQPNGVPDGISRPGMISLATSFESALRSASTPYINGVPLGICSAVAFSSQSLHFLVSI